MKHFSRIFFASFCAFLLWNGATAPAPRSDSRLSDRLRFFENQVETAYDARAALAVVAHLQRFWRNAGNLDFTAAMDTLAAGLRRAGYGTSDPRFRLQVRDTLISGRRAWQPIRARLQMVAPKSHLLADLHAAKMSLCVNSASTPDSGVTAALVFIDTLKEIAAGSLRGKIAYTHFPPRAAFRAAVRRGGALGIVSSYLPGFNRPEKNDTLVSMSSIPQMDTLRAFAFKISRRRQKLLDSLLARGPVVVHADVRSRFLPRRVRELRAEIRGRSRPAEYIALIAHVDEPGANDNASGSAALLETAAALRRLIASGRIPPPERTLVFLWVEEFGTVRRWKASQPQDFHRVKAAIVLDMVGENTKRTGGRFLVEKAPDPAARWTRPPDAHTEWGKSAFPDSLMRGTYINDLFLHACQLIADREAWEVKANPFEGGSDHVPFLRAGIPAVLAWHFTDQFYHTSGDRLEMVSPQEMRRVSCAVAATAMFLAGMQPEDCESLVSHLVQRAQWRLDVELRNSRKVLESAADREQQLVQELQIIKAWRKWYVEAVHSVQELPIIGMTPSLQQAIQDAERSISTRYEEKIRGLANGR